MARILIFFVFVFVASQLFAQNLRVVNAKTGQPVEGVLLFSEKFSTQTDSEGKAKTDMFQPGDLIYFKHSSFLPFKSTKNKIEKQGNIVLLIEDPVRLNEVVVSVNRWEQSKSEIPHSIKSIQADEIMKYNPQTTADLLGTKGGVFIQKSQMGGGSPMIRGFSANRVLIMVDGIRMNNAIFRSGNLHNVISLDASSLESTEIIFGPGSVIYGSDALGGVMSFNTLKPRLSTKNTSENSGVFSTRYSSANIEKTVHANYNFASEKWAAVFGATYTDFDDLRMGSKGPQEYLRNEYVSDEPFTGKDLIIQNENPKIQKYTAYSQFNLMGKLRFRPSEFLDFTLSGHHSQTSDIPRYDRLIEYRNGKLRDGQWYYGPQNWTLVSGQMQLLKNYTLFDKLIILTGFQNYEESRHDRKLDGSILSHRTENLDIYSVNIDLGKTFDKKNELFYGVEGYINRVGSVGMAENVLNDETSPIASRYPDNSRYESLAAYYSFKYIFTEKLIFQVGSRFSFTHLQGEFDSRFYNFPFDGFEMKNSAFNGNLGLVWHPTENWQINMHGSTGFRSPNIDDVAKVFDSEPGHVVVPNPDLKPEYARNLELNVIRNYSTKARIEITGFYTWLKDAMVRRDFSLNGRDSLMYDGEMSKVEALVNAESATIFGASFSFEYLFLPTLRTRNDLTITRGKDSDDFPVRHVPPTFGSSHLIFENVKLFVDLYADYSGSLQFEELAPDEQAKPHLYLPDELGNPYSPGWWTLNLKCNYKIKRNTTLGGGIENLLDKRFRAYSSGIVAPGINFVVSVNTRF